MSEHFRDSDVQKCQKSRLSFQIIKTLNFSRTFWYTDIMRTQCTIKLRRTTCAFQFVVHLSCAIFWKLGRNLTVHWVYMISVYQNVWEKFRVLIIWKLYRIFRHFVHRCHGNVLTFFIRNILKNFPIFLDVTFNNDQFIWDGVISPVPPFCVSI